MKVKSFFLKHLFMLTVTLLFLAGSLVSPTEALARGVTLSQEEISRYTEKLQNAKQFQTRLSNRMVCIQGVHDKLLSQKHAFELQLGTSERNKILLSVFLNKKNLYTAVMLANTNQSNITMQDLK